jgi:hypothetical protein
MFVDSGFASSLVHEPNLLVFIINNRVVFLKEGIIPNSFADLKVIFWMACNSSKTSMLLLLGETKTDSNRNWTKLLNCLFASRMLLISLFVRKSDMQWVRSFDSARDNSIEIRTSGFS